MSSRAEWTFADGWILMAVFLAAREQQATLDAVVAAADMMNHAIPTALEVNQALGKLKAVDVLLEPQGHLAISPSFHASLQRAYYGRGGLFQSPDKGRKWLKRNFLAPDVFNTTSVTEQEFYQACELYQNWGRS